MDYEPPAELFAAHAGRSLPCGVDGRRAEHRWRPPRRADLPSRAAPCDAGSRASGQRAAYFDRRQVEHAPRFPGGRAAARWSFAGAASGCVIAGVFPGGGGTLAGCALGAARATRSACAPGQRQGGAGAHVPAAAQLLHGALRRGRWTSPCEAGTCAGGAGALRRDWSACAQKACPAPEPRPGQGGRARKQTKPAETTRPAGKPFKGEPMPMRELSLDMGTRHRRGRGLRRGPPGAQKAQRLGRELRHDRLHRLRAHQPVIWRRTRPSPSLDEVSRRACACRSRARCSFDRYENDMVLEPYAIMVGAEAQARGHAPEESGWSCTCTPPCPPWTP